MATHPHRTLHTVLVEPDLWTAAQAEAHTRNETVSDAIRRALRRYTKPKKVKQ